MTLRSRGPRTLRGRVSLSATIVIAGWLIILAAGFDLALASRLDNQVDDTLRVRAQAASATVVTRAGEVIGVRESATDADLDSTIWVYDRHKAIAKPAVARSVLRTADSLAASSTGYTDEGDRRFYVLPVRSAGTRDGTIVAAIDLGPYERTRDAAILGSIVVTVLLLFGAYPVLRFATGRALRPVHEMTRQAAEWSINSPSERFGRDQRFAELGSLSEQLDALLDRLAAVLRHERQMSAELSHELRTPLARVSAQVDLMLADARPDQHGELAAIQDDCTSMDGIIETLLTAARVELVRTVGHCELGPVLAGFVVEHGPATVTAVATDLTVGVEAAIVTRILTPILENAQRYAVSNIDLRADRIGRLVTVEVSNDGPLLAERLQDQIFEPGFRAIPDDGHDGVGLGLALARRLARAADGDLLIDSTASRMTFRLLLPAG